MAGHIRSPCCSSRRRCMRWKSWAKLAKSCRRRAPIFSRSWRPESPSIRSADPSAILFISRNEMTLRELNNHVAIDELPEELNGQPIPNLRMTEKEFLEWCHGQEGVKAEWVDGEVIVMAPASGEHVDL